MDQLKSDTCDVVTFDLSMPVANGLDLINDIKAAAPKSTLIVLSMHPVDQFGLRAIKVGAHGYLNKESAPDELVIAINTAIAGETYLGDGSLEKKGTTIDRALERMPSTESLSNREFSVMRLIYAGHPMKEIAALLELSPKTVSTYRQRILEKLSLNSNAELIQYIMRHKIAE